MLTLQALTGSVCGLWEPVCMQQFVESHSSQAAANANSSLAVRQVLTTEPLAAVKLLHSA